MSKKNNNTASNNNNNNSSYDAFRAVDDFVSKPVLGSDGAAQWQEFTKRRPRQTHRASVAPTAPLKHADRAVGITSWQQERQQENQNRIQAGDVTLEQAGYTHFKRKAGDDDDKNDSAEQRKREKQIRNRIRPAEQKYLIPSKTFQGPKFDYIFTTRDSVTGYYWDGMDSLKRLDNKHQQQQQPIETTGETTGEDRTTTHPKKKKKTSKKQKHEDTATATTTAPPVATTTTTMPMHPLEQVAAALQRQRQVQATLPPGWEAAHDSISKNMFYYNRTTGQRQWEPPSQATTASSNTTSNDDDKQQQAAETQHSSSSSLPTGWKAVTDATSGKEYYYHETTGTTQWEKPTDPNSK